MPGGAARESQAIALFSMALASLADPDPVTSFFDQFYPGWQVYEPQQALGVLADSVGTLPSAVILDSVVRLATTMPDKLKPGPDAAAGLPLDRLLNGIAALQVPPDAAAARRAATAIPAPAAVAEPAPAAVAEPAPAAAVTAPVIQVTLTPDALTVVRDSVFAVAGQSLPAAWNSVRAALSSATSLGGAQWTHPVCTTTRALSRRHGVPADAITLTLQTSRSVAQMAPYADPRNWPNCSAYFAGMRQLSLDPPGGGPDWVGVFDEEIVGLPASGGRMVNPLQFTYHETYDASGAMTEVRLDYELLANTPDLLVDEGYIYIRSCAAGAALPTCIDVVKTVRFRHSILDLWPDFPCATYWGELGLDMCAQCSNTI